MLFKKNAQCRPCSKFHSAVVNLLLTNRYKCHRHASYGECPKLCVWGLAHAVKTGHLLNRSGYRIANRFRAATHSLTHRPDFSKLRMAR